MSMPKFEDPPVVETATGVTLEPLQKWGVPHFGIFWQRIRNEFPAFSVQPPLAPDIERFGERAFDSQPMFEIANFPPEPRCWYLHRDEHQLLQIQNDRFIYNWRNSQVSKVEYPGYDEFIRPQFAQHWRAFLEFLAAEGISNATVLQTEVTYVNIIPQGQAWESIADWWKLFPVLAMPRAKGFLPSPESQRLNVNYAMPDGQGRLRVAIGLTIINGVEAISLNLTARGKPASTDVDGVLESVDRCRKWVVEGFADFTSDTVHKLWKREP